MSERTGPLSDLRVIELGQLVAGPFCGQMLADFGADVIKVEPPSRGDPLREWGRDGFPLWWSVTARNKRTVTANLREPEGQDIVRKLAMDADILIENFRPGTMERWGLGYETLSADNPGLIMVRISGYGQTGPYASRPGYASVGEAMGGLRYVMGEPDRVPSRAGISLGDSLTGLFGAFGALAALHERARSGRGQVVDAAIYESVLAIMEGLIGEHAVEGRTRERSGSHLPGIAPSNVYRAADGLLIIAANQDTVFRRLAEAMGDAALANDARYSTHVARGERQAELDALIGAWAAKRTVAELEAVLLEHAVPHGRLFTAADMLADPHYAAREAIVTLASDRFGALPMQNVAPKLSRTPGAVRWPGPERLGSHTEEVLTQVLDLTPEQVERLRASGIV